MKAAAFDLVRPDDMAGAFTALADREARAVSGGQSLGPMLNYRVVRPTKLVEVAGLTELSGVEATEDAITIGASVTHAAIEDGRVPDIGPGILSRVAGGIAYRAIRNRGTIGGSLSHADPAADWVTVLAALDAAVLLVSQHGSRTLTMTDFLRGAYQTALQPGELLQAIRIPRQSAGQGWGYSKLCRKPGEFAHAMAAVSRQADGGCRVVVGALGGAPLVVEHVANVQSVIDGLPGDRATKHIAGGNLLRAWDEARSG